MEDLHTQYRQALEERSAIAASMAYAVAYGDPAHAAAMAQSYREATDRADALMALLMESVRSGKSARRG